MMKYQINQWIYSSIRENDYAKFKCLWKQFPQPRGTPVNNGGYAVIHKIAHENLRIVADLLRHGADIRVVDCNYKYANVITYNAILSGNIPLLWLLLYMCGVQAFCEAGKEIGKTAIAKWREYSPSFYEYNEHTVTVEWPRLIQQQKNLIAAGRAYHAHRDYSEAVACFTQAAEQVLTFHYGDEELKPFYQEEAIPIYQLAVESMIADITTTAREE